MTDPLAEQDDASTPLSSEEREGLIPSYIALRGELNEAEQANILEADAWASSRARNVLDPRFLNTLHKRMYGNVWRWAGTYRKNQKNIDIEYYRIPTERFVNAWSGRFGASVWTGSSHCRTHI